MRKKIMIILVAFAAIILFGGYALLNGTIAQASSGLGQDEVMVLTESAEPEKNEESTSTEPAESEQDEEVTSVERAEKEYAALMERQKEVDEIYSVPQESDEEILEANEKLRQLREDSVRYYQTYGWDKYDGAIYHDREALIKSAEGLLDAGNDIIYMIEYDIMPLDEGQTKEERKAFYERRIEIVKAFIEKAVATDDADIKALSGELEYLFEIHGGTAE